MSTCVHTWNFPLQPKLSSNSKSCIPETLRSHHTDNRTVCGSVHFVPALFI